MPFYRILNILIENKMFLKLILASVTQLWQNLRQNKYSIVFISKCYQSSHNKTVKVLDISITMFWYPHSVATGAILNQEYKE